MRRPERGFLAVCAIAAVFAAILIWLGLWRYGIYRAGVDDGIFTQVILSIGGCFCATAEGGMNHMLVHWSPILALGYPFVRIFGGARGLVVLQALAVAATALPLYAIARLYAGERAAAALSGVAMLYPVFWAQTFTDFHENAFVPALGATLVWALAAKRWRWGAFAVLCLLLVKEDQFVQLAGIGVLIAIVWRRDPQQRLFGACVAGAAVLGGIGYFEVFRSALHQNGAYMPLRFYDWSLRIQTPLGYVGAASPERLYYLFWALAPLLFLPLGSRIFLLAIPGLLEVLASHERITMVLGTHYSMLWSGYVAAAFVATAAQIAQRRPQNGLFVSAGTFCACLAVLHWHDPMSRWYYLYRGPDANDALLTRTLASLPRSASVGASDEIYAHLGDRDNAITGVRGEYYVSDEALSDPTWDSRDKAALDAALRAGSYRITYRSDGIIVARRTK